LAIEAYGAVAAGGCTNTLNAYSVVLARVVNLAVRQVNLTEVTIKTLKAVT
jgi:hypothetical protein